MFNSEAPVTLDWTSGRNGTVLGDSGYMMLPKVLCTRSWKTHFSFVWLYRSLNNCDHDAREGLYCNKRVSDETVRYREWKQREKTTFSVDRTLLGVGDGSIGTAGSLVRSDAREVTCFSLILVMSVCNPTQDCSCRFSCAVCTYCYLLIHN